MVTSKPDPGSPVPEIEFSGDVITGSEGSLDSKRFAIVVSKYHWQITGRLLNGAIGTLREYGVTDDRIQVIHVPGSWEIPLAAAMVATPQSSCDGIICLGCVVRGETSHDQHINTTVSNRLGQIGTDSGIPVAFGLLTCNTMDQARARAGGDEGNKGEECARAVIHMLRVQDAIES